MAKGRQENQAGETEVRPPARWWRVLRALILLPFQIPLFILGLLGHLLLFICTVMLCAYLGATTYIDSSVVSRLLTEALPGSFHIRHVQVNPLSGDVHAVEVAIRHPDGTLLIQVEQLTAQFNVQRLALWGLSAAMGFRRDIPIHLPSAEIENFRVLLDFRDHHLTLVDAFDDGRPSTDDSPKAQPHVLLETVITRNGNVTLLFDGWSMDVALDQAETLLEVRDAAPFIQSRDVIVPGFRLTGKLLPENLRFLGNLRSRVHVPLFRLNQTFFEALNASVMHPDLDVQADFQLYYQDPVLPVNARGTFRVHNGQRLTEVSMGQVTGTAMGSVTMSGSLEQPKLDLSVRSPQVLVAEILEISGLEARAVVLLDHGVRLSVPRAEAILLGSSVRVTDAQLDIHDESAPRIEFSACVDDLRPDVLARWMDLDPDEMPLAEDAWLNLCVHDVRLSPGSGFPSLAGTAWFFVSPGYAFRDFGLNYVEGVGDLVWTPEEGLRVDRLALDADAVSTHGWGSIRIHPALHLDVQLAAHVPELSQAPILAELGLAGALDIASARVLGSLDSPALHIDLEATAVTLLGFPLDTLELGISVSRESVEISPLCVRLGDQMGCLALQSDLRLFDQPLDLNSPVRVTVTQPVRGDLSLIPLPGSPVSGSLHIEEGSLSAVVSGELPALVASLAGSLSFVVRNLGFEGISLDRISGQLSKRPTTPEFPVGSIDGELELSHLVFPGGSVRLMRIVGELERFAGMHAGNLLPSLAASATLALKNVSVAGIDVASMDMNLASMAQPDSLHGSGTVRVSRGVLFEWTALLDWTTWMADLAVQFKDLRVAGLPLAPMEPLGRYTGQATATGQVRLTRIPLRFALAGSFRELLRAMKGQAQISVSGLANLPESIRSAQASAKWANGTLELTRVETSLGNGTRLRLQGRFNPFTGEADVNLSISPTKLSSLELLSRTDLPADAVVSADIHARGKLDRLAILAEIRIEDLELSGHALGGTRLIVSGTVGETLTIRSEEFLPGLELQHAQLVFRNGVPAWLNLDVAFSELTARQFVADFPEFLDASIASGTASIHLDLRPDRPPVLISVAIPERAVSVCSRRPEFSHCMTNPAPVSVVWSDSQIAVGGLVLEGGQQKIGASGSLHFRDGWNLQVDMAVALDAIPQLADAFAAYSGTIRPGPGGILVHGPLDSPSIRGSILLDELALFPRGFNSEFAIARGIVEVRGNLVRGNLLAVFREDAPISGTMDDGSFRIHGWARVADWTPDSGALFLEGRDLFYQSPGEFKVLTSPRIELTFSDMADPKHASSSISGDVQITEGEFTRNFDRLIGSFSTAFSRSQSRYSRPITEVLPFLRQTHLNLQVRGGNFAVSSKFPFGSTELTVDLDLRIAGTLENLQIRDRMRVVPGGLITYKVVKRVFEVVQGNIDFSGNPSQPYLDVKARTEILYRPPEDYASSWSLEEKEWGRPVSIFIHITGVYPAITFELTSDSPEFDPADLQTLLLLGVTRRDLEGRSPSGSSDISINILTDDVAGMVSDLILAPFVDAVSLGFTREGGIRAEAETRIGRALNLQTRVRQEGTRSEYSAGFQFKITDRLMLEGKMKMVQDDAEQLKNFEGKFRYIIPLD
jgi:hypothetical protein